MGNNFDFMGNLEVSFFPIYLWVTDIDTFNIFRTSVFPFWVVSWEIRTILQEIWK